MTDACTSTHCHTSFRSRVLLICLWLVIGLGCSGIKAPKEYILRNDRSYEKNLTQLQSYLGQMPVDVVVAGYTPAVDSSISVEFTKDSAEATIKKVVITKITPESTLLRLNAGSAGSTVSIPTKHVTSINANGIRTVKPSKTGFLLPILLGILSLISIASEGKANDGNGCRGGCLAAGILLGVAALIALVVVLGLPAITGDDGSTFEYISKKWIMG